MNCRSRVLVGALAVAALLAGGCANPDYQRGTTRGNLEQAGLTSEQAACVTSGLERRIGNRRLTTHAVPTETEFQKALEVLDACGVPVSADGVGSS